MAKRTMKRDLCSTYCAQMLYCICKSTIKGFDVPSYAEMIDDRPKDTRTGQQIIDDMIANLERG